MLRLAFVECSKMNRRTFLRRGFLLSLAPRVLAACADDSGTETPVDELPVLPDYSWDGPLGPENIFSHGIASGDPLENSVILWTRVSPGATGPVEVWFEIALDEAFEKRYDAGFITTDEFADYTAKIDASELPAGKTFYYRFFCMGRQSPVGRTNTLPAGEVPSYRFAVVSCSSLAHGYFNSYRRLVERDDIQVVLHLGDYIYEYGSGEYGNIREYEPSHEILTLEDYRMRYAQYRRDVDLQAVHNRFPMIAVWDDHESANNSWSGGAENHSPDTEAAWETRKAAARQAYSEWMPIRESDDGRIYRSFRVGELLQITMLDTRLWGRDEQSGEPSVIDSESRQLLGADQEAWLKTEILAAKGKWNFLGQQVMIAQTVVGGAPLNNDAWDGYTAARGRLLGLLRDNQVNDVVVLTGDIHSSWACDVTETPFDPITYDPATGNGSLAVELVTPAISSPGFPTGIGSSFAVVVKNENPHIRWVELEKRGYIIVNVTAEKVRAEWYLFDDIETPTGVDALAAAYAINRGGNRLVVEPDSPSI